MSLLNGFQRALVLCAHTDDELACAGTIVRLARAGVEVHYLALSKCEESVPDGLPRDVLVGECRACLEVLGVAPERVAIDDFRVRYFPRDRQEILERLVGIARTLRPDLVLLPSSQDRHQDHATVHQEGFRAFKNSSILGYELPQNLPSFDNSAFVTLSEDELSVKLEALAKYASQSFRPYSNEGFIRALAFVRGVQVNATYAEAFELVRLIVRQ